jgi:hypothetical protein
MGNFFQISSSSISSLLGYIGVVFNNYEPIFLLVIALAIGLFVFGEIVNGVLFRRKKIAFSDDDDEGFDDEDL